MERILVTGSSGMVGSKVLKHLMRRNLHAIAGVRDINSVNEEFKKNIDFIHLDYKDLISIEKAKKIVDKIFLVPPMHPDMSDMMRNVLDRMQSIQYIVCISASGADANSSFPLLKEHGKIKDYIINSGIPATFIAPSHFYQNYFEFSAKYIKEKNNFYLPQGNAKKTMIDTNNIGEIVVNILLEEGHVGKTYHLGGYDYDNFEIARNFTKVLGKKINYIDIDPDEYKKILIQEEMPEWKIEILLKLNSAWKAGSRLKSNQESIALLGRNPTTFEEFLQENKEFFL